MPDLGLLPQDRCHETTLRGKTRLGRPRKLGYSSQAIDGCVCSQGCFRPGERKGLAGDIARLQM